MTPRKPSDLGLHCFDVAGIANNVDPDQTAPRKLSVLGLHCFAQAYLCNTAVE